MPEDGDEADQRAERQDAAAERTPPTTPPIRAKGRLRSTSSGQAQRAEVDVQDQQDADERQSAEKPAAGCCAAARAGVLAEELGVVAARRSESRRTRASISRATLPEVAARTLQVTSIRREAPSRLISLGVGGHDDVGHVAERDLPARRRVDAELAQGAEVAAHLAARPRRRRRRSSGPRRPRPTFVPSHQRGHRAADVARGQAEARGGLRAAGAPRSAGRGPAARPSGRRRPSTSAMRRADLCGLLAQDVEVGPEDADHDRRARAGEHLLDALLQVGEQVAVEARVAVDDLLDLGDRRVVVDRPGRG